MTHPIATYDLDEDQLLAATVTEIAEARAHLGDAEQALVRNGKETRVSDVFDAAQSVDRAMGCINVARSRVGADEVPIAEERAKHLQDLLRQAAASCEVAMAHVKLLLAAAVEPGKELAHAKKAIEAAKGEAHKVLADLLTANGEEA
jgi:hypothetical protein